MAKKEAKNAWLKNSEILLGKLKIFNSQRDVFGLTTLFYRSLTPFFSARKTRIFREKRVKKRVFLVQNEENQLLHQLSNAGIWVVQTLTFGICLANFSDNLHDLHA